MNQIKLKIIFLLFDNDLNLINKIKPKIINKVKEAKKSIIINYIRNYSIFNHNFSRLSYLKYKAPL
ncbi:hypothetical protein GCWU000282_03275 [Catonella morbi ATCC 51271]|uniref:Uncharacterized protein n=1 Tax=Catonella morbi ATCC 51271 TaxID=592026 RepID=V2Y1E7_9FIRM|nr:hypothetical protein GCWU000282_03275 [Catonella morbi ATCC 51271]